MRLSISNIIWAKGKDNFEDFLKAIVKNNIFAVELSLNSIFEEPLNITKDELNWLKTRLKLYNVSVSSLHSLTYTRPDLEIFNDSLKREELYQYLVHYMYLARELNAKNIVYGSPKSRKRYGKSDKLLESIFIDFLYKIDEQASGINFNIEPLPKLYCEYLNTFMDGVNIIKKNKFNNIFIQLDVRSIIESEEDIDEIFKYNQYIKHVHIGEPNLTMPSDVFRKVHKKINSKLSDMAYTGYCAIEVINHEENSLRTYVNKTIENTRRYYHD
jgi:sugar phosphate isomerase/epimerase